MLENEIGDSLLRCAKRCIVALDADETSRHFDRLRGALRARVGYAVHAAPFATGQAAASIHLSNRGPIWPFCAPGRSAAWISAREPSRLPVLHTSSTTV